MSTCLTLKEVKLLLTDITVYRITILLIEPASIPWILPNMETMGSGV